MPKHLTVAMADMIAFYAPGSGRVPQAFHHHARLGAASISRIATTVIRFDFNQPTQTYESHEEFIPVDLCCCRS